ncbi:MAG: aspartate carbamoyltransferase [Lentisphaeraceae bacterium]|nr:aspartate carbamoyltransferase [Lentisphaeraceae bacterium]
MNANFKKYSWDQFSKLSLNEKAPLFNRKGTPFHCLIAQQFSREFLDHLYHITNVIRAISKSKNGSLFLQNLLPSHRAMLYFMQPSTRTYLSFKTACQILGVRTSDVRDSSISSEVKGESSEDTIRTFSSYFDFIIMRHPEEGMAEKSAWVLEHSERPVPVLNAGSGKDQHPTQALLDIYTLRRSFETTNGLAGKTILLVGDLLRGRTVRSLAQLLAHFEDVKIIFSSPEKYRMKKDVLNILSEAKVNFIESNKFKEHLPEADAIYMTRVQDEHDTDSFKSERSFPDFSLTTDDLKNLKPSCAIMHPLPRRSEIDPGIDNDPRAKYWRQERNGMWTRAALMLITADKCGEVINYWRDITNQVNHTAKAKL